MLDSLKSRKQLLKKVESLKRENRILRGSKFDKVIPQAFDRSDLTVDDIKRMVYQYINDNPEDTSHYGVSRIIEQYVEDRSIPHSLSVMRNTVENYAKNPTCDVEGLRQMVYEYKEEADKYGLNSMSGLIGDSIRFHAKVMVRNLHRVQNDE